MITRLGCAAEGARFLMAAGFPTRWGPPDYLENCTAPKIFIQSTHDQYGPRAELEAMYERFAAPSNSTGSRLPTTSSPAGWMRWKSR